jgi:hypothetical protein
MPPARMPPNEVDRTNYISGARLVGTMEETLSRMKIFPVNCKHFNQLIHLGIRDGLIK